MKPIKKTHVTHILLLLGSPLEGHLDAELSRSWTQASEHVRAFSPVLTPYTSAACFCPYGLWSPGQRKLWVALKPDGFGFSRLRVWLQPQLRSHVKQPRAQRAGCTPTTCHAHWCGRDWLYLSETRTWWHTAVPARLTSGVQSEFQLRQISRYLAPKPR